MTNFGSAAGHWSFGFFPGIVGWIMMRNRSRWLGLPIALCAVAAAAPAALGQQQLESVYAPPELPVDNEGVNEGAVHFELGISYFTDYVFRGVERFEVPGSEDSLNLQLDAKLSFDLGKLPHPYVAAFVNVAADDVVSNFQEIRPTVGFDWTIKPLVISGGFTSYIYPNRNEQETSEVFVGIALDDRILVGGQSIPVPYAMAAYDFDLYDGLYLEAGLRYRLAFDDIGLVLTANGSVAYLSGYNSTITYADNGNNVTIPGAFSRGLPADGNNTDTLNGFQHWQIGVTAEYSLNKLFSVSTRYGEWSLRGSVYYTEDMDREIAGTNQIWGGGGIVLRF